MSAELAVQAQHCCPVSVGCGTPESGNRQRYGLEGNSIVIVFSPVPIWPAADNGRTSIWCRKYIDTHSKCGQALSCWKTAAGCCLRSVKHLSLIQHCDIRLPRIGIRGYLKSYPMAPYTMMPRVILVCLSTTWSGLVLSPQCWHMHTW